MNDEADVPHETDTVEVVETPPELTDDEAALAAMDAGVTEATPEPAETVTAAEPVEPAEPLPGTPEAAAAEAAKTAEAAKPEPDTETEAEIATLGLKEKSAERFRGLVSEVKAFTPAREAMEKAGIKDAAELATRLPELVQHSKDYADLIGMVQETKATPEQYGYTLDYLKDANAAIAGDLQAAQRAFDKASGEVAAWAQLLGKEVPGVHDPLKAHADLQAEVEKGDLTRDRALEIAQQRTALSVNQMARQHQTETVQASAASERGIEALNQLGQTLAAADPDYARKQPFLLPTLRVITQTMPPSKWVSAAQQAYTQIPAMPAPVAAPAPPKVVPVGPVRAGSHRPALTAITDDPMEAMNQGIAAASG